MTLTRAKRTRITRLMAQLCAGSALCALSALALSPSQPLDVGIGAKNHSVRSSKKKPLDATLILVIDGDTLLTKIDDKVEKIRLIGIDAPEAEDNEKAARDSERTGESVASILKLGKLASRYVAKLTPRKSKIKIVLDQDERDQYGRLLGYVYLSDGTFLNETIVADGYATLFERAPDTKYQAQLAKAYRQAKAYRKGLWALPEHQVLEFDDARARKRARANPF